MKHRSSSIGFTLVVALLAALIPAPAHADHAGKDAESRNSARFGPIGSIGTKTLGDTTSIDGRIAQGGDPIWGGELISAAGARSVQIDLDSIGQVTLDRRSSVRLASASSGSSRADVLIATLVTGTININLNGGARAYVEAGSSAFSASAGASFSVRLDSNGAALNTLAGEVRAQDPTPPQDVNIRIVDELGRPVSAGAQLSVRARSTRQVQVQVTDKNDKPLPDLPVLFSLGDPCLGSLGLGVAAGATFRQKTDKRGIATVPLITGAARCAASILVKVEGTNASVSIQTNVVQNRGFWNTQNTLLV
ncbi:MAG TPA: hypothetical protein VN687_11350, partial [Blastocatellia bacterium]|nr:hypothetical protein [Blastocatellia bacterium]